MLDDLSLVTALDLFRLDSHYLCEGEWERNFLVLVFIIVVVYLVDYLLDLLLLKSTHKA